MVQNLLEMSPNPSEQIFMEWMCDVQITPLPVKLQSKIDLKQTLTLTLRVTLVLTVTQVYVLLIFAEWLTCHSSLLIYS